MNRAKRATVLGVVMLLAGASATTSAPTAPPAQVRADQLPNLVPYAPANVEIGEVDGSAAPAIRFAATIANHGDYAFELVGNPDGYLYGSDTTADQCVEWAGPRVCSARRSAGTLTYHSAHGHYHFEDFALYELRKLKKNGMPNMKPKGLIATSEKVSFCLQDVERSDDAEPLYLAPWPLYYGCTAGMGVQGISPGWLDIYSPGTPGQQIPLKGIADGTYALVVYTDPGDRVFESDDEDNVAVTGLLLAGEGTKLSVVCESAPGALRCR